ncbi:P-loop containing nucleoside triphosphate hydrolase protein [Pavlovales sp. CCMP2436]|nr:P-loop containing nucleoside triphosphate hydrolase protein [Pavlovales sp. CCMP2436]
MSSRPVQQAQSPTLGPGAMGVGMGGSPRSKREASAGPVVMASSAEELTAAIAGEAAAPAGSAAAAARCLLPTSPMPVVVCGPSGVGKGTLVGKLLTEFPDRVGFCCSHTTRAPRPGEEDGVHYHFSSVPAVEAMIAQGEFLEHAKVHSNYYGTSRAAVKRLQGAGKICLLDIDVQEAEDKIRLRLTNARSELLAADEPGFFDHVLVNDDLDLTYARFRALIVPDLGA